MAGELLALTAVRLAAIRGLRWDEIEGLDWTDEAVGPFLPTWRVPAARMKLAAAKKGDARHDHLVPLSTAAIAILRRARQLAGDTPGPLVFAGRGGDKPIGIGAIGALYDRAGYGGRHVPHGWRATFSTILNERYPGDRSVIDRALAHSAKDKVEAAYNRSEHLVRRRWLFERWGEMLKPLVPV